jgi:hypothetical protein
LLCHFLIQKDPKSIYRAKVYLHVSMRKAINKFELVVSGYQVFLGDNVSLEPVILGFVHLEISTKWRIFHLEESLPCFQGSRFFLASLGNDNQFLQMGM